MSEDEIILTHILQCRTIDLTINKPVLTPTQQEQFKDYKLRRSDGEPLQYILGTCNFMGFELVVGSAKELRRIRFNAQPVFELVKKRRRNS